jgi:putative ABC transport system permease protein
MSLWKIAWRSIQQRALASTLTAVSMALGVTLVISVLVIHAVIDASFRENAQGYDMIVGGKGGALQLVLNTVFYLSRPTQNLPWSFYKKFTENGQFAEAVEVAIPVCMGDNYEGFRVVGTTPQFFDLITCQGQKAQFAEGCRFNPEHYFEAVIGARVARKTGLKLKEQFRPTHGVDVSAKEGHQHAPFTVVGILAPTGTPNDRAMFINIEGFFHLDNHLKDAVVVADITPGGAAAKAGLERGDVVAEFAGDPLATPQDLQSVVERTQAGKPQLISVVRDGKRMPFIVSPSESASRKASGQRRGNAGETTLEVDKLGLKVQSLVHAAGERHATEHHAEEHHAGEHHDDFGPDEPVPDELKEVTAILVRRNMKNPVLGMALERRINKEQPDAQAVLPAREITELFDGIVGNVQKLLLLLAVLVLVVAGIGIMVSIYNSMSERRHEIAVMRALGAGRVTVMLVILLESILLSLGGGGLGLLLGHGLIALLNPMIVEQTGVSVPWLQFNLLELILIPGLLVLASLVGYLPALAAYRTDVAKSLRATP